ncbi:MAG: putative transposase [Candidatus Atribacteria bacterium]|nr:putative transposase [Candidatus Atribacteria bacterium]
MTKAERIKSTLKETRQRRETQQPVVYELKLQNLNKSKTETRKRVFLEAKWLYNWMVSNQERLRIPANKVNTVEVKTGAGYEQRKLTILGSQIKQEIADRLKDNLRALGQLKEKGDKVGKLKPRKFVNSIPLKQYGVTYSLDFACNRVRIQKLGRFRVLGLHQKQTLCWYRNQAVTTCMSRVIFQRTSILL